MLTMTQCTLCFTWDLVGSSRAITCSVMAYCVSVTCSWSVICSVMAYCVSLKSMTGTLKKPVFFLYFQCILFPSVLYL